MNVCRYRKNTFFFQRTIFYQTSMISKCCNHLIVSMYRTLKKPGFAGHFMPSQLINILQAANNMCTYITLLINAFLYLFVYFLNVIDPSTTKGRPTRHPGIWAHRYGLSVWPCSSAAARFRPALRCQKVQKERDDATNLQRLRKELLPPAQTSFGEKVHSCNSSKSV